MKQAPYGTWQSPLAAADLAGSAIALSYVAIRETTPYWVESGPAEGGRNVIVTAGENGAVKELTPQGFNVRTRVHEYGGTPYALARDAVYFSNFTDQRVYAHRHGQEPVAITPPGYRYADYELTAREDIFSVCGRITLAAVSRKTRS